MRRETRNEIIITVVMALVIVVAALYGFSSPNTGASNGPTLQTFSYNMSTAYSMNSTLSSMNTTLSTVTNNGVSALDILNTSSTDNRFSPTSTGYYLGTLGNNGTIKFNS